MDENNRPHGRDKETGTGSAHVGKGEQVHTGGPVGSGGRPGSSGSGNGKRGSVGGLLGGLLGQQSSSSSSGSGKAPKLNLKTILIVAVILLVGFFVVKKFGPALLGGGGADVGIPDIGDISSVETESDSSYKKVDTSVDPSARSKYVTLKGNGEDEVTIMVYMCGTDLESKYGMATSDLNEMLNAKISDKVNLIVLTGGCSKWKNSSISNTKNQIYKVESKKLVRLEDNFGTKAMTDPDNLSEFIKYCAKNFPANRNMLIFWDHGGGSISGYGYDEKNPKSSSMTLTKIDKALKNGGVKFDTIGFDACLMATLETALVCNNHADYLIASEETEPGTGWFYTNWLNELSQNTSVPTVNLAQRVIDDFVAASCAAEKKAQVTLSVVDLSELESTVPAALSKFAEATGKAISGDDYKTVANARAGVRQFAKSSKINQVDLIDLANRIGSAESKALAAALKKCVKYNQTTISRSNGISIYFPYETTSSVGTAVNTMEAISGNDDMGDAMQDYSDCIKAFASLEYGGQIAAASTQQSSGSSSSSGLLNSLISSFAGGNSSTSPVDMLLGGFLGSGSSSGSSSSSASAGNALDVSSLVSLLGAFSGRSMPQEYAWVDTELIANNAEKIAASFVDPARITATEKNGQKVLSLTDEEWNLIQTIELNVFVKDEEGEGFLDLGLDNLFSYADAAKNDLLLTYDETWLCVNEKNCAFYLVSDSQNSEGLWVTEGKIPALLNGELVYLKVIFKEGESGRVTGAYPMYEDSTIGVEAKGNIEIQKGDKIEFLCDYYGTDGSYQASYKLGTSLTVPKSGLKLENLKLDNTELDAMYRLTDIYGNHFWIKAE